MSKRDVRYNVQVDHYIAKSAEFARPVMEHLRELIHKAIPDIEEHIKWGMPAFYFHGPLCSFAAFKQHAVFGFWKTKLMDDPGGYLGERSNQGGEAMGNLGRITNLKDLPPDKVILDFLKQAKRLNEEGIKVPAAPKKKGPVAEMPDDLLAALKKNKKAMTTYDNFSATNKKEYVEWITEAKTETTRKKRIETAVEWMAEGKIRNWKYVRESKAGTK